MREKAGPFAVGLRVVEQYDHSRLFPSASPDAQQQATKTDPFKR